MKGIQMQNSLANALNVKRCLQAGNLPQKVDERGQTLSCPGTKDTKSKY